MFTQIVMLLTIFFLCWTGIRISRKIEESNYPAAKMMAAGIFLIAFGIVLYIVRDIFTQLGMYEIQEKFTRIGGFLHVLGSVLIFWFFCKEFTSELFGKISFVLGFILITLMMIGINVTPLDSEVIKAPFEPFPYVIIRNFPLEQISLGTPISWIVGVTLIFLLIIVLYNVFKIKGEEKRRKGLFYGFGFLFLIFPLLVCVFFSPILARIGYLIGSILIFKASRTKI